MILWGPHWFDLILTGLWAFHKAKAGAGRAPFTPKGSATSICPDAPEVDMAQSSGVIALFEIISRAIYDAAIAGSYR
jgi:hypothetical protein